MSIRAKFKVDSVTRRLHWIKGKGDLFDITLSPVTGGSRENEKFYAATPGGKFELSTMNEEAAQQLELGEEYYIDFTKSE